MASAVEPKEGAERALRHILVVGGDHPGWLALGEERWAGRLAELGKVADHAGASWLTLRPYTAGGAVGGSPAGDAIGDRRDVAGGCVVAASAIADGRQRLVEAIEALRRAGRTISEESIAAVLNDPAGADPDLVVILGPGHRLPPSLVWELAYSELVFVDAPWVELHAGHLERAIDEYAHRHRRFGGLD